MLFRPGALGPSYLPTWIPWARACERDGLDADAQVGPADMLAHNVVTISLLVVGDAPLACERRQEASGAAHTVQALIQ